MTPLHAIQRLTRDTIAAADYFSETAAMTVLLDRGNVAVQKAHALNAYGQCVRVPWVLDGALRDHGSNIASVDVGISVVVESNPEKTTLDIFQTIKAIIAALLSWKPPEPANSNQKFRLSEKAFVVSLDDPGLLRYHVFFQKLCTF